MFWRLRHSSSLDVYHHGDNPCALITYTSQSEALGAAMCDKLLSRGFYVMLVTTDAIQQSPLQKSLKTSHPDKKVAWFSVDVENLEKTLHQLSENIQMQNITIAINFTDASILPEANTVSDLCSEVTSRAYYPHGLFVEIQRLVLPNLVEHSPSSLLLVSNTLSPLLEPMNAAIARYLDSFASALSHELYVSGYIGTHVTHMDYYDVAKVEEESCSSSPPGLLTPSSAKLSDSILQAVGHKGTHITPYWSHEVLTWIIWILLCILPQSVFRQLIP